MLKSILNLKGAQQLSKKNQGTIQGGKASVPTCQIGCYGLNERDLCYAAADCQLCGLCVQGVCEPR